MNLVAFRVPSELAEALRRRAAADGLSVSQFLRGVTTRLLNEDAARLRKRRRHVVKTVRRRIDP